MQGQKRPKRNSYSYFCCCCDIIYKKESFGGQRETMCSTFLIILRQFSCCSFLINSPSVFTFLLVLFVFVDDEAILPPSSFVLGRFLFISTTLSSITIAALFVVFKEEDNVAIIGNEEEEAMDDFVATVPADVDVDAAAAS